MVIHLLEQNISVEYREIMKDTEYIFNMQEAWAQLSAPWMIFWAFLALNPEYPLSPAGCYPQKSNKKFEDQEWGSGGRTFVSSVGSPGFGPLHLKNKHK